MEPVFPFLEARKTSINQMKPLKGLEDVHEPIGLQKDKSADDSRAVLDEIVTGEACSPLRESPLRAFKITLERMVMYGSPGCKACENRTAGHPQLCCITRNPG